ncbi:MAG: YggS family pyridoxal phosphate-dependent enzyme [Gemmatimonadota bacterium]
MRVLSENPYAVRLAETLPRVHERMARAAEAAHRSVDDVLLVAVTKSHPLDAVRAALDAGLTHLGENRVEELEEKVAQVGREGVQWHMIGHLQRRKAARAAAVADLIHSVDTERLARRLSRVAVERAVEIAVLAQVNTSGEETKSGLAPGEAVEAVHRMAELPGLRVEGLMTMAPFVRDESVLGAAFARLRELLEALHRAGAPVGRELSMGMTNDLEIAIREGSTMIRIGTALFGERVQ